MIESKISLRQYQRDLAVRLARNDARQRVSKLGVRAAGSDWLIDLADAGEVIPVPAITGVPLTRPWFAGVTNVRGNLYAVVDFSLFAGAARTAADSESRLLLIADKYKVNCALLVQAVLGLYRDEELTRIDQESGSPWIVALYRDARGATWNHVDMNRLAAHQEFLQIGIQETIGIRSGHTS